KLLGQFVACLEQRLSAEPEPASEPDPEPTPLTDAAAAAPKQPSTPPRLAERLAAPAQDDSLDLGAAVIPVLLKGYWKQGLGGLLVLLVAWRVLRRR
ncbi:MAG: carbon monoxide dehydrogenase, partial [Pimelobacter sp.]|nr:carbon monoxide dehydrogenase [Pimelobacter sp.]